MAASRSQAHMRVGPAYSVLLFQKLLSLRDAISPLTLVLDTLRSPGVPLLEEMMLRARCAADGGSMPIMTNIEKTATTRIIYVSGTLAPRRRSPHVDVFVERRGRPLDALGDDIRASVAGATKSLIVIDSLCQIARQDPLMVAAFVSSLVSPTATVVGLYHTDDGVDNIDSMETAAAPLPTALLCGKPRPFTVLCHLATAVLRVTSLHEEVSRKRAQDHAEPQPAFGLAVGEGWPLGYSNARYSKRELLQIPGSAAMGDCGETAGTDATGTAKSNSVGILDTVAGGVIVEMELRRRSGRAVVEKYVVVLGHDRACASTSAIVGTHVSSYQNDSMQPKQRLPPWKCNATPCTNITRMVEHMLFAAPTPAVNHPNHGGSGVDNAHIDRTQQPTSTFSLGLTEKQQRDREGIVLPYFDAQTHIGASAGGGRILYDMGREDDFDDEEDEI